jgi:GntR family transcriptional regulator, carbon starvation induced regulator
MMRGFEDGAEFVAVHRNLAERILARELEVSQTMLQAHLASTLRYVYPDQAGE